MLIDDDQAVLDSRRRYRFLRLARAQRRGGASLASGGGAQAGSARACGGAMKEGRAVVVSPAPSHAKPGIPLGDRPLRPSRRSAGSWVPAFAGIRRNSGVGACLPHHQRILARAVRDAVPGGVERAAQARHDHPADQRRIAETHLGLRRMDVHIDLIRPARRGIARPPRGDRAASSRHRHRGSRPSASGLSRGAR